MANGTNKERLELVLGFVRLYDGRRSSLESRTALLLSANALLFAVAVFIMTQMIEHFAELDTAQRFGLLASLILGVALVVSSVAFATVAIANVWRTSEQTYKKAMPPRLFFYPRQTLKEFKDFKEYLQAAQTKTDGEMLAYATGELWVITREYRSRYSYLRWALRLMTFSFVPLLASIALLVRFLWDC